MKLIRPKSDSPTPDPAQEWASRRTGPPQWLVEWLEDKGEYVALDCGHKDNLKDRSTLHFQARVRGKKKIHVLCARCNDFRQVKASLTLREYLGIKTDKSQEPLF